MTVNSEKMYGLIGYPLGHSFSQNFFNQKFESEGIKARYVNFELPTIDEFPHVLAHNSALCGLNVTIPYKEKVIKYMDELDDDAAKIGAVNVVKIMKTASGKRRLKGYNSDIIGFCDSLRPLLTPARTRALILGTGGAAKAVRQGLLNMGIEVTYVSRTAREGVITYDDLTQEVMEAHKIIVNATPLGMYPHVDECPPIPYECLTPEHLLYDLLYNPSVTLFMKRGEAMGAEVKNGLEMLLLQAFASWNIWNE